MVDPITATTAATAGIINADKTGKLIYEAILGKETGLKKINPGDPGKEKNCQRFYAYISHEGALTKKKCLVVDNSKFNPSQSGTEKLQNYLTLEEVRNQYCKSLTVQQVQQENANNKNDNRNVNNENNIINNVRQQQILDADGYELPGNEAVYNFSSQCRVSLRFTESRLDTVVGTTKEAVKSIIPDGVGGFADKGSKIMESIGWGKKND